MRPLAAPERAVASCSHAPSPSLYATRCRGSSRNQPRPTSLRLHAVATGSPSISPVAEATSSQELDPVACERFPAPAEAKFNATRDGFSEEHRIRGYEVDPQQRTTMVTMANLLQEAAGNHAVGMWGRTESGFASLPGMHDLVFVMTRLQIRMHQYPKWGDIVNIQTFFTEEGRLAARRDWRITDASTGQFLGCGTSTWVSINTTTRKLAKLPDGVRKKFMRLSAQSHQCALPPEETRAKLPDMVMPAQIEGAKQIARRSDMDMNGHINNVTFLAWALETTPQEVYSSYRLHEIEVDFKAECKAGQMVESHCNPLTESSNGNGVARQFLHMVQRCDDSGNCFELVRARSTWKPK